MEPYFAEIRLFAGNFAPRGWAFCNGQVLAIAENQALFSLLGATYGGNGWTTFALPDLRGRAPVAPNGADPSQGEAGLFGADAEAPTRGFVALNYIICTSGCFPSRPW